jgi:hypothetical protein
MRRGYNLRLSLLPENKFRVPGLNSSTAPRAAITHRKAPQFKRTASEVVLIIPGITLKNFTDDALQVFGLEARRRYWVIRSRPAALQDTHFAPRFLRYAR